MYEDFFGFTHRPFSSVPSLVGYQQTASQTDAEETLVRCVLRDEGIATLIAAPGLGKTTVAMQVEQQLENQFEVIRLNCGHCGSRRALLQAICYELNLPYRGLDEGDLRIGLAEFLERLDHRRVLGVVILADEADMLPIRLLEELRLLTNFTSDSRARVSVVLIGNLTLEERLTSPYLTSFNQRIGARAFLSNLNGEAASQYVVGKLAAAGIKRTIFDVSAMEAISNRSQGIPRVINQICDHALLLASVGGETRIDADGIEEAWADLQRLPVPKRTLRKDAAHSNDNLIEFGALEDSNEAPSVVRFEKKVEASTEPAQEDEYQVSGEQPEVELVFQNAINPFDERFDKEEFVVERFQSLGDQSADSIQRVTSPQESEIAAFLVQSGNEQQSQIDYIEPSYYSDEAIVVSRDFSTSSTAFTESDDRDIIVIEQPAAKQAESPKMPTPRRRTYRQLFSQLRRDHA